MRRGIGVVQGRDMKGSERGRGRGTKDSERGGEREAIIEKGERDRKEGERGMI